MIPRRFTSPNQPQKQEITLKSRMKPGDVHMVVSGTLQRCNIFDHNGTKLYSCPARTKGVYGSYDNEGGDTPPGVYLAGVVTHTQKEEPDRIWSAYGRVFVDLIDLEGQETGRGRAGIGMHGGGSALADPLAQRQGWADTHGCIRFQNEDIERIVKTIIEPTQKRGNKVYVNVVY